MLRSIAILQIYLISRLKILPVVEKLSINVNTNQKQDIKKLIEQLNLLKRVFLHQRLAHPAVPNYIYDIFSYGKDFLKN